MLPVAPLKNASGARDDTPEMVRSQMAALARDWLGIEIPEVSLDADPAGWLEVGRQSLRTAGRVRLVASPAQRVALAQALPALNVAELELESLQASVSVARFEQSADRAAVVLHIPDFVNG